MMNASQVADIAYMNRVFRTECHGCGRLASEILVQEDETLDDLEQGSVWNNAGDWYCHIDCLRDSR